MVLGDDPVLGGLRGGDEHPDVDWLDRVAVGGARADAAVRELIAGEQAFLQGGAGADQRYRLGQFGA